MTVIWDIRSFVASFESERCVLREEKDATIFQHCSYDESAYDYILRGKWPTGLEFGRENILFRVRTPETMPFGGTTYKTQIIYIHYNVRGGKQVELAHLTVAVVIFKKLKKYTEI